MLGFLIALVVAGLAGWLASIVVGKNSSLGLVGNIVVGLIGGLISSFLFGTDGFTHPTIFSFLLTVLGAIILLVVVNLIARRTQN